MATDGKTPIRLSWDEWRKGRAARREALARCGLSVPCRRTTAKPRAIAALNALLQSQAHDCNAASAAGQCVVKEVMR